MLENHSLQLWGKNIEEEMLRQQQRHVSYPVNLGVLQQELHDLCVASSGCKVQRGAELAIQQVWITVPFLQ